MRLYELTNKCYIVSSIMGLSCSTYLLFWSSDQRGFFRTALLVGWTILSGVAVLKMIGEMILAHILKGNPIGGIKKRLIEKVHNMVNQKLVTALYLLLMFGMILIKLGMPFLLDGGI